MHFNFKTITMKILTLFSLLLGLTVCFKIATKRSLLLPMLLFMLFFVVNVFSQRIIYSEDFSTDNGAGFDNGWIAPTSSTWTMVLVGSPDVTGGGDYCAVYNNRLEWQDLASTSMSNRVDWYSPVISGI